MTTAIEDFSAHLRAMAAQEQQVRALATAAQQDQDWLRATVRELQAATTRLRQAQQAQQAQRPQPARPEPQAPGRPALQAWEEKRNRYRQLVARVREAVEATVPPGATVAVVSKGDEELLRLGGRPAEHLPQTPQGIYAGHHPADSAEAVAQLESLREKGAQYLVIPQTMSWWLEHYAGFRQHLDTRYRRVRADDACALYCLTQPPPVDPAAQRAQYQQTVRQVREAVRGVTPEGATVVVVSKGDANLLDFEGRQGWHFPRTEAGAYAGYHPADSEQAIRHLEALRRQGARYLVFPSTAFWWLDHYAAFRQHLDGEWSRAHADSSCVIYAWPAARKDAEPKREKKGAPARKKGPAPGRATPPGGAATKAGPRHAPARQEPAGKRAKPAGGRAGQRVR